MPYVGIYLPVVKCSTRNACVVSTRKILLKAQVVLSETEQPSAINLPVQSRPLHRLFLVGAESRRASPCFCCLLQEVLTKVHPRLIPLNHFNSGSVGTWRYGQFIVRQSASWIAIMGSGPEISSMGILADIVNRTNMIEKAIDSAPAVKQDRTSFPAGPKLFTLAIVQEGDKVLLGKKKRGFGTGFWFGFGGKLEPGETIEEAAVRELQEESGLCALALEKRAILTFHFDDKPQPWEVHVFHVPKFEGTPSESDEMAPRWFSISEIPYEGMYADDPLWLPPFLQGKRLLGEFSFVETTKMVTQRIEFIDSF